MSVIIYDPTTTGPTPAQRAVEHPDWCDPRRCATHPDTDAELMVIHRAVLLDEQLPGAGQMLVQVVSADILCAHGGERLAGDPVGVRVDTGVDQFAALTPEQASRLAVAVARAAEIAGGAR